MTTLMDPTIQPAAPNRRRDLAEAAAALEDVLVGVSAAMQHLRTILARIAPSRLPVLIEGPTGSGKEVVADCLHRLSGRSGERIAVNMSALPHAMFESLMFGHVRGAFTSAQTDHTGYMAQANGGTLFLDELEALDVRLQPKLLRALEDGWYRPVGATRDRRSDCRVVVATNEALARLRATGQLRRDLEFRLAKLIVRLIPLADRREDIPALVHHFAWSAQRGTVRTFTPAALGRLEAYDWPGNVRELKTVVETVLELADDAEITRDAIDSVLSHQEALQSSLPQSEVDRMRAALEACNWHVVTAATRLGMHFTTLYRRMKRYGIEPPDHAGPL